MVLAQLAYIKHIKPKDANGKELLNGVRMVVSDRGGESGKRV